MKKKKKKKKKEKRKKKRDILFSLSLSLSFPKNKQTAYQLNMGDEGEHLIITALSHFGSPKGDLWNGKLKNGKLKC